MAFYLKEHGNTFEYYDREILIKALSQLEYGAEESLDRRNNTAIYFNTDPQYDVFTLDGAIDKLIDIVGDDSVECLLSFHKYFLMGILLIWQEEGDVASEFIQKVVTTHCENIRTDMLLSRLQGLKADTVSENNKKRVVNLQIFSVDNIYDVPDFNADVPEITIKSNLKNAASTLHSILKDADGTGDKTVNFSSVMVDSILGYLDYNNDATNKEDLKIYDFLYKVSKRNNENDSDILREKLFYSMNFAENRVTSISLSQCPLPTYAMLNNSKSTLKKLNNGRKTSFPNTRLDLSIGRYSSISDIVKDVENAKKSNPNTDGINDLLFNDSCEIHNAFKAVFMNFLYERFIKSPRVSNPGQEFLENVFKDLLLVKKDKTRYADYTNLTNDIDLSYGDIEVPDNSYFRYLKDQNTPILKNQNIEVFKYLRTNESSEIDISKLQRELIFESEESDPVKFIYGESHKPTFFSILMYDADAMKNTPGYKYDSVKRVFFDDKQYLSSFEDPAPNTMSSGIACPYYLAPYGISLFKQSKLYLPLFKKMESLTSILHRIISYYSFWDTYCNTTISGNKFINSYKGPYASRLLYDDNTLSYRVYANKFCRNVSREVTVKNEYPMLCLKLLNIIDDDKYDGDYFLIDSHNSDIGLYHLKNHIKNNLKEYISAGRKVYLELQEIVEYLKSFSQVTEDIKGKSFRKYFKTLYENIKNENSEYSTLSGDIESLEKLISQDNVINGEISNIMSGSNPSSNFIKLIYALNEIYLLMDDMSKNLQDIVDFCNSPGVKILRGKVWSKSLGVKNFGGKAGEIGGI